MSTDLFYGATRQAQIENVNVAAQEVDLPNIENLPIVVEIDNISQYNNEVYALLRRNGFGGSDSSVLLGVNPYKTLDELIKEKATDKLSEEEKAVGEKVAVRKGNDLEPLIIDKFSKFFGVRTIKPIDMYKFKEYPFLKMNFDGVATPENERPYPVEIKVCTYYGEKHYNPAKAIFREVDGFQPLPLDISDRNISIENKAAHYGIPPYYYTQIQTEMMALDAPYGLLAVLFDKTWQLMTFMIWKDTAVQNQIILNGYKAWQKVEELRAASGVDLSINTILANASVQAEENYKRDLDVD